jgi:polyphosphate kinase
MDTYIGSADLMGRNLDYRVEVLCPILDKQLKHQLSDIMEIQWNDNCKARIFDKEQSNRYKRKKGEIIRSQDAIYDYYRAFFKNAEPNNPSD